MNAAGTPVRTAPSGNPAAPMRCTIAQAHALTGLSCRVLRDQAARGAIPGASKPSGRWLFVIEDLNRWAGRIVHQKSLVRTKVAPIAGTARRATDEKKVTAAYERVLSTRRRRGQVD